MRLAATVLGAGLVLAGSVWVLQGLDVAFAPRSFMTGATTWVLIGGVAVASGLALAVWGRRRN